MKYIAVLDTDDYEDFEFFEDGNGKYIVGAVNNEWIPLYFTECEQVSILDKIKAEIEQITDTMGVSYNQYVSKIDVLQIIDKYKAGSEE